MNKSRAVAKAIADDRHQVYRKLWIATLVSGLALSALTLLLLR
jgi:hypothetical protein